MEVFSCWGMARTLAWPASRRNGQNNPHAPWKFAMLRGQVFSGEVYHVHDKKTRRRNTRRSRTRFRCSATLAAVMYRPLLKETLCQDS